jgi:hypothetical protein
VKEALEQKKPKTDCAARRQKANKPKKSAARFALDALAQEQV